METGTLAELRHLTRTSVRAELARPPDRAGRAARRARPGSSTGHRVSCQVDNRALDELLAGSTEAGVRSLASQPPTLEELFLRHYADPP